MRSSLDYAGFAQLCGRSPIMCEIMRAHNRIIPRSLVYDHESGDFIEVECISSSLLVDCLYTTDI